MLTDDENIVDVQFAIQYTLKGPEDFLFNNRNPEDNVLQAAETAIREVVGKSKMDFVLNQVDRVPGMAPEVVRDASGKILNIKVSAVTGAGIELLRDALAEAARDGSGPFATAA